MAAETISSTGYTGSLTDKKFNISSYTVVYLTNAESGVMSNVYFDGSNSSADEFRMLGADAGVNFTF